MLNTTRPALVGSIALALSGLILSGCTAGRSSSSSAAAAKDTAPSFTWASTALDGVIDPSGQPLGLAGDSSAFAVAVMTASGQPAATGECSCTVPKVYASGDGGATWHPAAVPGLTALAQQPVAGYGNQMYVLGESGTGSNSALTLWTSTDAEHWSAGIRLPESADEEPGGSGGVVTGAGIAAGSGGVEVFIDSDTVLELQHSPGGSGPWQTVIESLPYGGTTPVLSPDGAGFLFAANGDDTSQSVYEPEIYTSADGVTWVDQSSAFPVNADGWGTYAAAGNSGTAVVSGWTGALGYEQPSVNTTWAQTSQPDGLWLGTQDLDPGRIPQPGTGPAGSQSIEDIVALGPGFLATGLGSADPGDADPASYAGVWYSPNGSTWTKQPEINTGFSHAASMANAAVSGTRIVLIGYKSSAYTEQSGVEMWHGTVSWH
jgi:hypothetical protein